jgi:hypothetical protein
MGQTLAIAAALCAFAAQAMACTPIFDERSPMQVRMESRPVAQDAQCRMINGGVYDNLSLGPAENLDNGRIAQAIGTDGTAVVVVDCATREATILRGPIIAQGETTCGPYFEFGAIASVVPLTQGADLHELVRLAEARGASELNPLEYFFEFSLAWQSDRHPVPRRDRFNLLCGCARYYPESAGAS